MFKGFETGKTVEFDFAKFRPRLSFLSERRLRIEIVSGKNAGFKDEVDYELASVTPDVVTLSWQETVGSVVVHVIDVPKALSHCFVAAADGSFLRLIGRMRTTL